jgi:hypothetical protein
MLGLGQAGSRDELVSEARSTNHTARTAENSPSIVYIHPTLANSVWGPLSERGGGKKWFCLFRDSIYIPRLPPTPVPLLNFLHVFGEWRNVMKL